MRFLSSMFGLFAASALSGGGPIAHRYQRVKGRDMEVQMNPINLCTKPKTLRKLTLT